MSSPAGAVDLSWSGEHVHVRGLSPGGTVILLGATREVAGDDVPTTREYAAVASDTDRDGIVELALRSPSDLRGIFFAIDSGSGDAVAMRRGSTGDADRRWLGQRPTADDRRLQDDRRFLLLLLVRPGSGAWFARTGDASELDRNRVPDLGVDVAIGDLSPLAGEEKAPAALRAGDRVVALDPDAMELVLEEIEEARQ